MTMKRMTSSSTEELLGLLLRTGLCVACSQADAAPIVDVIRGPSSLPLQVVVPQGNRR
jgi:hypothetical protein